jgi:glucosyl-dolichyl phosphate glucuronosyltransferase
MIRSPLLSIVICTYNNAESLGLTLAQLNAQELGTSNEIDLLVVDNNSSDDTSSVCKKFIETSKLPARYIFENRQGLSHARNTGVSQANGEFILFTDDDAELPSFWLQKYLDVIAQHQPDCAYSKIDILWEQAIPWWFISAYNPYFVCLNYGENVIHVTDIHHEFYGKNFMIRKSLISELGGFDPKLGRNGSKLIAGEETLLYRKMIALNKNVIYFPDAPVGHRLKEREYLSSNIKKLFIDGAYSSLHISQVSAQKKIIGRPLRAFTDNLLSLFEALSLSLFYFITRHKQLSYYHYLRLLRSFTFLKLWTTSK